MKKFQEDCPEHALIRHVKNIARRIKKETGAKHVAALHLAAIEMGFKDYPALLRHLGLTVN
jgi:hypothetical protein